MKKKKQDYNNSDLIIQRNTSERNIKYYVERTKTLQRTNIVIALIVAALCLMSSYVLIVKQESSKLYLTGVDGRIFEYKNDKDSAKRIRDVRENQKNEK